MQQFSSSNEEQRTFSFRVAVAIVIMLILFIILLFNLVNLQIINNKFYLSEAEGNRYNNTVITPKRGKIFDRNGVILADNELSFSLMIVPKYVKDIKKTLNLLKKSKIISNRNIKVYYKNRKNYRNFDSIILANYLNEKQVAMFVALNIVSGVEIKALFNRTYPQEDLLSHVIGYVSLMNKEDQKKHNTKDYDGTLYVGRLGIERKYEQKLHGKIGFSKVEKNVQGKVISSEILISPIAGDNLYLSIDLRLQKVAEKLLKGKKGSIVLVDVRNGEILAAASAPSFNPNSFVNGISSKEYNKLIGSEDKPLLNRITQATYPPGSTLKPFVALAALENEIVSVNEKKFCRGYYQLPKKHNNKHKYRDWKRMGHGYLDVKGAIAQSCDVYFYDVSYKLGINNIHKYLSYFGFGKKTGVDFSSEVSGVLPSREWKRTNKNLPWYIGETVITGIGQGFFTVTPLQLAVATGALVNNGIVYKPKYVRQIRSNDDVITQREKEILSLVPIKKADNWKAVQEGMKRTIYGIRGTGRRLNRKKLKYTLGGKTGTAQVFGLDAEEEYIAEKLDVKLRDHALFIGYAPADKAEVAIVVIVENAGSGSSKAAPLAKQVLDVYFKNKL